MNIEIRRYKTTDCEKTAKLFYETVHSVNARDYIEEQLDVWASKDMDLKKWNKVFLDSLSIVAVCENIIAGFGNIDETGYLDRLYVHKDYQGKGIGEKICKTLEGFVKSEKFSVYASITAKPFFEKQGYRVIRENTVERKGVLLKNFYMEKRISMLAYTYEDSGKFVLKEKPVPNILNDRDAIVKVTLGSICSSDIHIKHGSVPKAVKGITVGHEMVGVVEELGSQVKNLKIGDRVAVNVETFCGDCFFCKNGFVNNCTDKNGGWALGCRIDGGQAEYVRVPFADTGLTKIPDNVTDEQALFTGDILATGFWAVRIADIKPQDTVLIIGAGPTGICTMLCAMLKNPGKIIVCENDSGRIEFMKKNYPQVITVTPDKLKDTVIENSSHGGADVVFEVAGTKDTFKMAWECARPNANVIIVALYDEPQVLPLPDMYGKNLTFKTGGVDGCDCEEILSLIEQGKIDTTPLITHTYSLKDIEKAYELFENKKDGVMKVAIKP